MVGWGGPLLFYGSPLGTQYLSVPGYKRVSFDAGSQTGYIKCGRDAPTILMGNG